MTLTFSNNKRIAKNTIFLYIRMLVVLFIQLFISRILLGVLGIEDYGVYNVVGGFISMLAFFNSSLSNGYQRFFNFELGKNDKQEMGRLFSTALFIQFIGVIFFLIVIESFGLWFLNYKMNINPERMFAANVIFQGAVIMLVLNMMRAPYSAAVIAHEKMDFYAAMSIAEVGLNLLVAISLNYLSGDLLIEYGILHPVSVLVISLIYAVYVHKHCNYIKFQFDKSKSRLKSMVGFSGWNLFGSLAHMLKSQGVNIVMNLFFGVTVNAARGVAIQIQGGLSQLYSNFQMASRPQMIKSYAQGDEQGTVNLANNIARFSFLMLWVFALPFIVHMDCILTLWLGENVPPKAVLFSRLSIIIALIESFAAPIASIVHATGKMRKFQTVCSSIILLIVPVSYVVLYMGSPAEGALYASIIILCIAQLVRLFLIKDLVRFSIKLYIKDTILPCLLSFVISIIICFITQNIDSVTLLHPIINGSLIFFLTALVIVYVGLKSSERHLVITIVKSKLMKY